MAGTPGSWDQSTLGSETRRAGPPVDPEEPREQVRLGRYTILRQLGRGGMGVVYLAYDPELERNVAIKLVLGARDDRHTARLLREARAIAKLSHPNVIAVHDVGEHDGSLYIAMEFVDGQPLSSWLRQDVQEYWYRAPATASGAGRQMIRKTRSVDLDEPRPWREVVGVFVQAARGLDAAHRAGVLHRDFKPDNAMIDRSARVRVLDFGLARGVGSTAAAPEGSGEPSSSSNPADPSSHAADSDLTRTGAVMGTPAYMSPEQHMGEELDARSDQFSFCVALYEALWGRRPFAGDTIIAISLSVMKGNVTSPPADSEARRVWPAIERGLRTAPGDRHRSMRELVDELELGIALGTRRRWMAGGAAAGVMALALGAWWWGRAPDPGVCGDVQLERGEVPVQLVAQYDAWVGARADACAAEVPAVLACLDERADELRYGFATPDNLGDLIRPVSACARQTRYRSASDPARAAIFEARARPSAKAVAAAVLAAGNDAASIAETGRMLFEVSGDRAAAVRALTAAARVGRTDLEVLVALSLAAHETDPSRAREWLAHAKLAMKRAADPPWLALRLHWTVADSTWATAEERASALAAIRAVAGRVRPSDTESVTRAKALQG